MKYPQPKPKLTEFEPMKFGKTVLLVIIAAGVGIGSVADQVDWENFEWSFAAAIPLLYGVFRAGWGWLIKNNPQWVSQWLPLFSFLLVVPLVLTGCISTPWSSNPLKSTSSVVVKEKLPDGGGKFYLKIKDDGDGSFSKGFYYQGDGENPWIMTLNADHELTSPGLAASFDSFNKAVEQVPVLVELFGPAPDTEAGRQSWILDIMNFAGQNRWVFDTLIGLLTGG